MTPMAGRLQGQQLSHPSLGGARVSDTASVPIPIVITLGRPGPEIATATWTGAAVMPEMATATSCTALTVTRTEEADTQATIKRILCVVALVGPLERVTLVATVTVPGSRAAFVRLHRGVGGKARRGNPLALPHILLGLHKVQGQTVVSPSPS